MRFRTLITVMLLAFATANVAIAKQIYKWTDENGNVHYEDRPMSEQSERVAVSSKPTDPARVQSQTQARLDAQARKAEEAAATAAAGPSPEERKAEAEEREKKCTQYRQTLQKFVVSRRLYREDENGERVYLDEAETQAARERVEGQVEEFCAS
jgi:hypothetical protein